MSTWYERNGVLYTDYASRWVDASVYEEVEEVIPHGASEEQIWEAISDAIAGVLFPNYGKWGTIVKKIVKRKQ